MEILRSDSNGVCTLTLNRPNVFNSFNQTILNPRLYSAQVTQFGSFVRIKDDYILIDSIVEDQSLQSSNNGQFVYKLSDFLKFI
jgi:hypothetical protein